MRIPDNFSTRKSLLDWIEKTIRKIEISKKDRQILLGVLHRVINKEELSNNQENQIARLTRRFG